MRRSAIQLAAAALCTLASAIWAAEKRAVVLGVTKGVMPNSVPEGTKVSLTERQELGGVCLKVVFEKDIWFADMRARDWSRFTTFRFDVLNPTAQPVNLNLTIKHKGTRNYETRVDVPLVAKPGRSTPEVRLADLMNHDGTRPDLSLVRIWSIDGPAGGTLYFGDFWLEGRAAPSVRTAAPPSGAPPAAQGIRVRGTFDITITGLKDLKIDLVAPAAPKAADRLAAAKKATLIPFSKGTLPRHVWNAKLALVEEPQLGGVALKATFAKNTWFADASLRIKDWRGFRSLTFAALNRARAPVPLSLTIKHKGTKNYDTRVDRDLVLAPGKNPIVIPLTGIPNNDGSPADLSVVDILTISCGAEATVLFGDFILE